MSNEFIRLFCPHCGGSLSPDGKLYKCIDCDNRFEKKKTETDSEKIRSILDEMKAEQVANIRRRLWDEAHKEYVSSEAVRDAAQKILDILPEDSIANFYKAAVSDGYKELNSFLDNYDASQTDDLPPILDFSIKVMDRLNISSVKTLVERGLTGDAKTKYYTKIEAEAEKIEAEFYNTNVSRSAFLAYSSQDMKKVNEVAAYLENEGFSCFIASRNLRHGKGAKENYKTEIENAIANCKCVVFLSSENSRAMTCDAMRIEIPYLRKTHPDKPRIEFLIEEYGKNTTSAAKTMLKEYFKNLEYCTMLEDLASRVRDAESTEIVDSGVLSKQQEEMMREIQTLKEQAENQANISLSSKNIASMIQRAEVMLAESDFNGASAVGNRILECDSKCAMGYVIRLLSDLKVKKLDDLAKRFLPFDGNKNYQKALEFADAELKQRLESAKESAIEHFNRLKKTAITIFGIGAAAICVLILVCWGISAISRKNAYNRATDFMKDGNYAEAQVLLEKAGAYKDSEELLSYAEMCNSMTFSFNEKTKSYTITKMDSQDYTSIEIPSIYNGEPVTEIGANAFRDFKKLSSVSIPNSVTSIGEGAFGGCSSLESMTLPFVGDSIKSATDTYQYPFGYIFGRDSYTGETPVRQYYYGLFKSEPTSDTYYIPSSLRSVTVTGGNILYGAFDNCSMLTNITISDSVISIGDWAFSDCYKLIEVCNKSSLSITAGSWDNGGIGYYAKHIITDEKDSYLTEKDNYIFYDDGSDVYLMGYTGTSTSLTLPAQSPKGKNYEIYQYAFYENSSLTSITIPDSVTSIGEDAFFGCLIETATIPAMACSYVKNSSLKTVVITSGTSIGNDAFSGCSSLSSITIPEGVTSIDDEAFYGCSELTNITFQGTKAQWNAISKGNNWNYSTGAYTIHCTNGDIAKHLD